MVVKNRLFYWGLIIGLSVLLLMNLVLFINTRSYLALLPIVVQVGLLLSLLVKYRYTKLLLEIWLVVFFMIAPGLQIVGRLLKSVGSSTVDWRGMLPIIVQVCIGVIVLVLLQRNIQNPHKPEKN